MKEKELQEIRNILKEYIRENHSVAGASDGLYSRSDIKILQQKEADRCMIEMMKQQQTIVYT